MPAPTLYEQLYSGYLRCHSRVFIAGEEVSTVVGHPTITRGLSSVAARADIIVTEWPAIASLRAPVLIQQRINNSPYITTFKGIVYRLQRSHFPRRATISCIDHLYLAQFPSKQEYVWENVESATVISDLLTACGIADFVVQPTGWIVGRVYPVTLAVGQPYWSLIEELDNLEGYRTLARPNGIVQRIRLPLFPGQAVTAFADYASPETPPGQLWVASATRGGPGAAGVRNRVVVRGIPLPGVTEEIAVTLDEVVTLQYIPDSGTVVVEDAETLVNFVEDTDFTIDYEAGTFTALASGSIAEAQYVLVAYGSQARWRSEMQTVYDTEEDEYVPVRLNAVPIEGSVLVTTPDGTTEYEEDTNYTIDYETGVLTPNEFEPMSTVVRVVYQEQVDVETTEIEITRSASNSALPPDTFQTEEISSVFIETHYQAALVATRVLLDQNRDADEINLSTANYLELEIASTITYENAKLDLNEPTPFLVTDTTGQGNMMQIRGIGGIGGGLGYLEPIAPEALFDYRIFAIGDIAVLTLIDQSFDLNDDIEEWNWNAEGYELEDTVTLTFDTSVDESFLAQLQVKDSTDLTSNVYAKEIDLTGAQRDIDTGRYRALTIFQLRDGNAALAMGGIRVYVGDASTDINTQENLAAIGSPYFSSSLMYLTPELAMVRPLWDGDELTFHGSHTFEELTTTPDIFDVPHTIYISTPYGYSSPANYDGYPLEPPTADWLSYLTGVGYGITSQSEWIWQWYDTISPYGVILSQALDEGVKAPGLYLQVFSLAPTSEGELPLLISESYFRYQSAGEFSTAVPFAINPYFMADPASIPYPTDPGVAANYPLAYQAAYGMPEEFLGSPNFSTLASRQKSRDVYRLDVVNTFPGNPVWFSHSSSPLIYVALNWGVYASSDLGNNWYSVYEWADDIWAGDYLMDGEVTPIYRYGYKWGSVAGNEYNVALAITGWSVARDEEADNWYDYHVEGAVEPVIYMGHRQPVLILETGERPEFPVDVDVRHIIALVGQPGFIVNARYLLVPDAEGVWQVTELTYDYPVGATEPDLFGDLENYRFTPHPTETDVFIVSSKAPGELGDYWAFRLVDDTTLEYLGESDDPYPATGGSLLAVTDQQYFPVEGLEIYSDDVAGVKAEDSPTDPIGLAAPETNDDWWQTPADRGE